MHFITLNGLFPCEKGPYSVSPEEMEWLKSDLQKVGKEVPVVVSIHVPMLSLYYPVVEGNFKGADMICNTKDVIMCSLSFKDISIFTSKFRKETAGLSPPEQCRHIGGEALSLKRKKVIC
mgnify:CR=1 FL=1